MAGLVFLVAALSIAGVLLLAGKNRDLARSTDEARAHLRSSLLAEARGLTGPRLMRGVILPLPQGRA